jgi:hypothetical protein
VQASTELKWRIALFSICLLACAAASSQPESADAAVFSGTPPLAYLADPPAAAATVEIAVAQVRPDAEPLFAGRNKVTVEDLMQALSAEIGDIATSPAIRREYEVLLKKHRLQDRDGLYLDYVRVRVAFEATRAGGLWGIEWRVTDQLPQSDRIWSQWQASAIAKNSAAPETTAIAECDELSALFAFVARRIGLSSRSQVGLLWPTSNHIVAVWVIGRPVQARVVVPTSQIFLDGAKTLDTSAFDPWKQKRIFDYARRDVSSDTQLPVGLARYFIAQVRRYGTSTGGELQTMRNRREHGQRTQVTSGSNIDR